jgi:hypothetical protein
MKKLIRNAKELIRHRDIGAAICAIILSRLCYMYSQGSESLQATINLSFYTQYTSIHKHENADNADNQKIINYNVARPLPFDLDGDGIVEAIIVPVPITVPITVPVPAAETTTSSSSDSSSSSTASWTLQVMDLKPLHSTHESYIDDEGLLPLYPEAILSSNAKQYVPVKMTTGQIFVSESKHYSSSVAAKLNPKENYYCGKTWHHANDLCTYPCPTGLQSVCPDGEICFADTSCGDKRKQEQKKKEQDAYVKNHLNGVPAVATIWSNGNVTLHGITRTADQKSEGLELVEMWSVNPFGKEGQDMTSWIEFIEVELLFEKNAPVGKHGALVVAARYHVDIILHEQGQGQQDQGGSQDEIQKESSMYFALDAFTGEVLWQNDARHRHHSDRRKNDTDPDHHLPLSSMGRRRSRLSRYTEAVRKIDESESSEDCLHHFGDLISDEATGVLPHSFWHQHVDRGSLEWDTMLVSSHFDRRRRRRRKDNEIDLKAPGWLAHEISGGANRNGKTHKERQLQFGHPNVVVFHNRYGINVLSLRNGKQICHLSLLENMLHTDINRDGKVDKIEVAMSNPAEAASSPCHAIVSSGTSETTIDICDDRNGQPKNEAKLTHGLSATPPLVVESYDNDVMTYDIVFALNNGLLKRYDIHGRRKWTARGSIDDIPSWDQGPGAHNGYLFRIDFDGTSTYKISAAAQRPILLSGDDSMALYTAGGGRLLDKARFPQTFVGKPLLQDLNGDGTTDVLITTVDGVWGYCVEITQGGSAFLRIINGLLASFVVVAFLFAYFEDPSIVSRRSTDVGKNE